LLLRLFVVYRPFRSRKRLPEGHLGMRPLPRRAGGAGRTLAMAALS
jgi:hypothetical protein